MKIITTLTLIFYGFTAFAQEVVELSNLEESQHQHIVLKGDWPGHALVMCGTDKHLILFPKLTIVFGNKLNSYRMVIGCMLYRTERYHFPYQHAVAYESVYVKPYSR